MSVSRWERGILEVPANIYIKLGNLAGDPLCWYFWGCAGLRSEDIMRVLPAARVGASPLFPRNGRREHLGRESRF